MKTCSGETSVSDYPMTKRHISAEGYPSSWETQNARDKGVFVHRNKGDLLSVRNNLTEEGLKQQLNYKTEVYLINNQKMHIYSFNDLKFTLKNLKRSYIFRSYDRPQGAYIVPAKVII